MYNISFICLEMPYSTTGNNNGFCSIPGHVHLYHYSDVIMRAMMSQITSLTIVYSTVYSGADLRKHHSSVSLAFVKGIQRWPVNSLHNGPVTWNMLPFDDVIMMYFVAGGRMAIMAHSSRPVLPPLLPRLGGAFDLRLAVSVPLPIVMGIFVLLWFQSRLT